MENAASKSILAVLMLSLVFCLKVSGSEWQEYEIYVPPSSQHAQEPDIYENVIVWQHFVDSDYELAIASANSVLLLQPEYESHHDNIKANDIRILLAKCYYNTGKYAEAEAQTELLGGSGGISTLADLLSLIEELAEK